MKIPKIVRVFAFPFSILYQLVLRGRNFLFTIGVFKETQFDIPTISVGNLAFGGTGKTPHIEMLIRMLQSQYKTAVLSRGYQRKTKGYVFASTQSDATSIGDEPMQLKQKFPENAMAVCEDRVLGLPQLLQDAPETNVVLLDDCFQHRYLKPGLNILLSSYDNLYVLDFLFPMGTLREYAAAAKRADIIIVTKCPSQLSEEAQLQCIQQIKPLPHQSVYFSCIKYAEPFLFNHQFVERKQKVFFFAGIANIEPAIQHLKSVYKEVQYIHFKDHQAYSPDILNKIEKQWNELGNEWQLLTTEKDFSKLQTPQNQKLLQETELAILPIAVEIIGTQNEKQFARHILNYIQHVQ